MDELYLHHFLYIVSKKTNPITELLKVRQPASADKDNNEHIIYLSLNKRYFPVVPENATVKNFFHSCGMNSAIK